jgi:hypothetical protein
MQTTPQRTKMALDQDIHGTGECYSKHECKHGPHGHRCISVAMDDHEGFQVNEIERVGDEPEKADRTGLEPAKKWSFVLTHRAKKDGKQRYALQTLTKGFPEILRAVQKRHSRTAVASARTAIQRALLTPTN